MHIKSSLQLNFDEVPEEVTCQFYLNKNTTFDNQSNKKLPAAGPHNYIDPRVLPCMHIFCKECIGGLAKESEKQGSKIFNCPTCNTVCILPEKGVEGLPRDLNLEFKSQAWALIAKCKNLENIKCMDCYRESKETKFCSNCCDFLCSSCADHHAASWRTKNHNMVKASEVDQGSLRLLKSPELSYCKDQAHTMYPLDFYCESCDVLLCQSCLLADHMSDERKQHKTQRLGAVAAQHKQEMFGLLPPAEHALQQFKHTVEKSKEMEERTSHVEKELKEEIEEKMKVLEKEVKARKVQLLKEVSSIANQKRQRLTMQRESFIGFQEQIERLVQKIDEATSKYHNHEVLSLQGLLQNQLKKQLQVFEQLSLHLNESSVIPNNTEVSAITTAVRNLGQVSCGSSAQHSKINIHFPQAVQGRERIFFITTLDDMDHVFELAGEDVKVKLRHKETGNAIEAIAEYKGELKQYSALVTPQDLGNHELTVTVRNRPLQGSPFPIWVREPRNWTELPTSFSQLLSSSVMEGNYVYGLAMHANGNLIVTQSGNYVRVVDPNTSTTIAKFGQNGSGDKQFNSPEAVVVRGDHMYIADTNNHRIQKLSAFHHEEYAFIRHFGGERGDQDNQLNYPRGMCFDVHGAMYVCDSDNDRIAIFESQGNFRKITHPQIKHPRGIAIGLHGNLHIVSYGNSSVSIFTPEGQHLQLYEGKNLTYPSAIAIDEEGYSFVVEYYGTSSRLHVFDPQHKPIKTITGFNYSESIAIAPDGTIIIGDRNNSRILKW